MRSKGGATFFLKQCPISCIGCFPVVKYLMAESTSSRVISASIAEATESERRILRKQKILLLCLPEKGSGSSRPVLLQRKLPGVGKPVSRYGRFSRSNHEAMNKKCNPDAWGGNLFQTSTKPSDGKAESNFL